jgi:hypothetical protein
VAGREALARHPLAIAGALITTTAAVGFIALGLAAVAGLFNNPYAGLVVLVALPTLFVIGLLLIPIGMRLQARKLARHPDAPVDWPILDLRQASVRRTALAITALTAANIVIVLLAGYGSLRWMESPTFCGQVCHTPMQPQYMAWEAASHSQVACVSCHVAEGARGFVHAKLAGVNQLVGVITNSVPKPIPGAEELPPVAQACLNCHRPGHSTRDLVRVIREYADDEMSSETATTLHMHMGAASPPTKAIYWHADPNVRVEYVATDPQRETIPYVKVTYANGQSKEYRTADATDQTINGGTRRTMECRDCHNRTGHPFAASAEQGIDQAIAAKSISRDLPFVRREAVRLVKASYSSENEAMQAIENGLRALYASQGGSADQQALSQSIRGVQEVYRRNVFPEMKVSFGSYPANTGHITSPGCFRCHDDSHTASDGSAISSECELCHTQVEAAPDTSAAAASLRLPARAERPAPVRALPRGPGSGHQPLNRPTE